MPCAFSLMLLGGSTNSIIQLLARDDMRGRVVALYAMGFLGMMPWGSLILGWVAEKLRHQHGGERWAAASASWRRCWPGGTAAAANGSSRQ